MFKILIVDDDKNIRYVMKERLELEKYTVITAKDGQEALDILDKTHVDLVIVDIMMPKVDGYEFTEELRTFNQDLPVLMVSAKQLPEDRKKGFISGIDDYMSKPIDSEELLLHIKALLRRANMANEQKIKIGDITIDYNTQTITKGQEVIELPQKEFMLLFKLLSAPNQIFTRIQIMDEIWGFDCDTVTDTVTVHISRLRKKFEGWDEFEIKSIKGLGYKAEIKV
ncbi:MAG: response regulator transcription factor [Clostridia bacterium]|nr:response regulator transcription factor [Clostridia bacterium]